MGDDHIFGDIQIEKYAGRKVDMLRELVKRDFGVRIDENAIPFGKLLSIWYVRVRVRVRVKWKSYNFLTLLNWKIRKVSKIGKQQRHRASKLTKVN